MVTEELPFDPNDINYASQIAFILYFIFFSCKINKKQLKIKDVGSKNKHKREIEFFHKN